MRTPDYSSIITTIRDHYPDVQSIYLFGSYGTEYERPDSDLDIAILLPNTVAEVAGSLQMSPCALALSKLTNRSVDLINIRIANTVFQFEILGSGRVVFEADIFAHDSFEMLVMSSYQMLNEERAEYLHDIVTTGRVLKP